MKKFFYLMFKVIFVIFCIIFCISLVSFLGGIILKVSLSILSFLILIFVVGCIFYLIKFLSKLF